MRRRRRGERTLDAQELVDLAESSPGFGAPGGTPQNDQWLAAIEESGYDLVDYFRARIGLRRRKAAGYSWDRSS